MAGPINNQGGLGLNGSKAGAVTQDMERSGPAKSTDSAAQVVKAATDEVSLSAAGKRLNAQDISGGRAPTVSVETPEQAAALAKQIASAMQRDGAQALAVLNRGDVPDLRGLLASA